MRISFNIFSFIFLRKFWVKVSVKLAFDITYIKVDMKFRHQYIYKLFNKWIQTHSLAVVQQASQVLSPATSVAASWCMCVSTLASIFYTCIFNTCVFYPYIFYTVTPQWFNSYCIWTQFTVLPNAKFTLVHSD